MTKLTDFLTETQKWTPGSSLVSWFAESVGIKIYLVHAALWSDGFYKRY